MRNMEAKAEYDLKHKKEKYFRVGIDIDRTDIDKVREAAQKDGKPLATWIKEMIYSRCDELGIELASRA